MNHYCTFKGKETIGPGVPCLLVCSIVLAVCLPTNEPGWRYHMRTRGRYFLVVERRSWIGSFVARLVGNEHEPAQPDHTLTSA